MPTFRTSAAFGGAHACPPKTRFALQHFDAGKAGNVLHPRASSSSCAFPLLIPAGSLRTARPREASRSAPAAAGGAGHRRRSGQQGWAAAAATFPGHGPVPEPPRLRQLAGSRCVLAPGPPGRSPATSATTGFRRPQRNPPAARVLLGAPSAGSRGAAPRPTSARGAEGKGTHRPPRTASGHQAPPARRGGAGRPRARAHPFPPPRRGGARRSHS